FTQVQTQIKKIVRRSIRPIVSCLLSWYSTNLLATRHFPPRILARSRIGGCAPTRRRFGIPRHLQRIVDGSPNGAMVYGCTAGLRMVIEMRRPISPAFALRSLRLCAQHSEKSFAQRRR